MNELAQKAELFEKFLDGKHDPDGLIYGDIKADEMRPWRNEDFEEYEVWDYFADDYAGYINFEDCIMATGRYISVKILKFLATKNPSAIAEAEQTMKALLKLAAEGDKVESGYLPKPHGGLAKASLSTNISTDQYEHATFAMWRFIKAFPQSQLHSEVENEIIKIAEYFVRNDFSYQGYSAVYSTIEERDDLKYPAFVSIHTFGLYMPLMQMAYGLTGDEKYQQQLQRLFKLLFEYDAEKEYVKHQNTCNLFNIGLYFCWKRGLHPEKLAAIMEKQWKLDSAMLSHDGLAYAQPDITDDHQIDPHYDMESLDPAASLVHNRFMAWRSNRKTAHSVKTAHSGALLQRVHFDEKRAADVRRIIEHYQKPEDFRRYIDCDGKQLPPEFKYHGNTIPLQFVGAWLEAYYLNIVNPEVDGF